MDVEVLEEISPLEYEARRQAANGSENIASDSYNRGITSVFKLKDLWASAAWAAVMST